MLTKKDLTAIQKDLSQFDRARERVLDLSRAATRMASSSILEIHRGDLKTASSTIEQAEKTLQEIDKLSVDAPELRSSNGVIVAFQEYVEAITLRKVAQNEGIVSIAESGADHRSYILGLLDAVGEFRRMALNSLRTRSSRKGSRKQHFRCRQRNRRLTTDRLAPSHRDGKARLDREKSRGTRPEGPNNRRRTTRAIRHVPQPETSLRSTQERSHYHRSCIHRSL